MGCSSTKDDLESKIMFLKLDRAGVMQERHDKLKELEKIIGHKVRWRKVPDYVVHEERREVQQGKDRNGNNKEENEGSDDDDEEEEEDDDNDNDNDNDDDDDESNEEEEDDK